MTVEQTLPQPWRRRLFLPAYPIASAANYAQTSRSNVSYWYYSKNKIGPALRGKEKRVALSYLQLVEVAFVATFRRLGFSLQSIRTARDYAAQALQAEFPFAQYRWLTEGSELMLHLEEVAPETQAPDSLVIATAAGQTAWAPAVRERFLEFDYDSGLAIQWHVAGRESPVVIDPRVSFGAPIVNGVPTWALKGRREAGESIREIAADFGIDEPLVIAALVFEGVETAA